jgi:hypothetical protein
MTSLEQSAILLTLLERLRQVTAAEAALLASFGLRRLHGLRAERRALAKAYTKASAGVALTLPAGLDEPSGESSSGACRPTTTRWPPIGQWHGPPLQCSPRFSTRSRSSVARPRRSGMPSGAAQSSPSPSSVATADSGAGPRLCWDPRATPAGAGTGGRVFRLWPWRRASRPRGPALIGRWW